MSAHNDAIYPAPARALHWITAAIVLILIPAGIAMSSMEPGPAQNFVFNMHRSLGVVLIPLVLIRVFWRVSHTPPPLPDDIPAPMQLAAHATHYGLYALLVAQPIVGWIATSAYRAPIIVFGLFELPPIWPENRALSETLFGVHKFLGIAMAVLICAHVGGALFHHFIRRDAILQRMWR